MVMAQFQGLQDGYNKAAEEEDINLPKLDEFSFLFLNTLEEFGDLLHVFDPDKFNLDFSKMTDDEFMRYRLETGSCSAMVKVTPELDDIFFTHSTWTSYYRMNRIYKHYYIGLRDIKPATYHWSMSSFPGTMSSIDDYYMMDSGLASMEVTFHILCFCVFIYPPMSIILRDFKYKY